MLATVYLTPLLLRFNCQQLDSGCYRLTAACRQPIAATAQLLTVKFLKNTHLRAVLHAKPAFGKTEIIADN